MKKLLVVFLLIYLIPQPVSAVMNDGHLWVKLTRTDKIMYMTGYWDGIIAGIGQGIRFAQDKRTPDEKVFKDAYNLWAYITIKELMPKIDEYYSNKSKREIKIMHAITQILVEMKIKKM